MLPFALSQDYLRLPVSMPQQQPPNYINIWYPIGMYPAQMPTGGGPHMQSYIAVYTGLDGPQQMIRPPTPAQGQIAATA